MIVKHAKLPYDIISHMKNIVKRAICIPELNIAFFSFLLNFSWEVLQTPFFVDISDSINTVVHVYIRKLWAYSPLMPVIPYLNVGLVPILQWIILPPIVIFITRQQLS